MYCVVTMSGPHDGNLIESNWEVCKTLALARSLARARVGRSRTRVFHGEPIAPKVYIYELIQRPGYASDALGDIIEEYNSKMRERFLNGGKS
jgi:hypothetical protein